MKNESTPQCERPGRRPSPELFQPYSTEPDPFQRLSAFASWQAQDTQREAMEELRKDADILSAVLRAQGQIAAAHLDLEQALKFIAEGARRLTGASGAAIAVGEGQKVVCCGRSGPMAPELGSYLNPQSGLCGQCLTSGEVQLCDDTEHDQGVSLSRSPGMRSVLAVPLRRQQDVLGVIVVFSGWAGAFGDRDTRTLKLLAALVIEALWSHEVHQGRATAPEPVEELHAPEPLAGPISAAPAEFRDAIASSVLPEPAAPMPQGEEIPALVETPVATKAESWAPAFAGLGSAELWPRRRTAAIIAGAIALLASATEAGLWRGTHVRELLHRVRPAVVAPHRATPIPTETPAPKSTNPATTADTSPISPKVSSAAVPADAPSQLLAIRSWWKPEGTTIAVFLQAPARWESGRLKDPERIYFDLDNTQVASEILGKSRLGLTIPVNDGLVNRVRVRPRGASAVRIVIEPAGPAEYSAMLSPTEPYRLMILVSSAQARSSTSADPEPSPARGEERTSVPHPARIHPTIVIDPGHGGSEGGAVGHGGLKEKDLTLQISRRLGGLLANRLGAQVIYTRTSDLNVSLEDRAAIANQASADLFISIHANSSDDPDARGVETYYVANAPAAVAGSFAGPEKGAEGSVLKPMAEGGNLSESRKLAMEVQQALYQAVRGKKGVLNRGVKQAPFLVLLDADMPSILAEVAFVSSPADEHTLRTPEGQEAVAYALYRGIAHYLAAGRRKMIASNGQ